MTVSGQRIDDKIIARMQAIIDENPGTKRGALSRRICEQLKWRSRNGRWKEVSCRKLLCRLQREGKIRLAEAQPFGKGKGRIGLEPVAPEAVKSGVLQDFQPLELILVGSGDREQSRIWNELMDRYHYLGSGPLCGAQLRYLIGSEKQGWIGGLSFSGAAWSVQRRDQWIGWSRQTREKNLNQVVANSRFLIVPQWKVPHLASHVLGLAVKRLGTDWRGRYGYEPVLVETFIDKERFEGTCYRAANWIAVGETQGRGRQDPKHRRRCSIKRIFVYPLDRRARERLCDGVVRRAAVAVEQREAEDWAEAEFGGVNLGDRRLNRRLLEIARDFYARPQAQIPQACQTRSRTKAAYRFFKHPSTNMDDLLEAHRQSSYRRIADKKIVLCPQDTTSLNYSTHPATENLGPIGSKKEGIIGLIVHDTMAFSLEGTPLGLVDVQCWARQAEEFGKKHQRKQRTIEEKESYKWLRSFQSVAQAQRQCPGTMLVSMGDREADIYELFHLALADPQGPKLLVRAEQDRLLADGQGHLWSAVAAQAEAGVQEIHVPRRGTAAARTARLAVRFAEVTLMPPHIKREYGALKLWAVLAQEMAAPEGITPLCWMLLTTCRVARFDEATEKLAWYTKRWGIEIYHRTLKSGCQIEERQLGDADTIEACLAIDMVVAWRVYHLTKLGREVPDVPCTVFCAEDEWKALTSFILKRPIVDGTPPTARDYMRMVAGLGGFLGRNGDGEPGTKSIWLGQQRLDDITMAYRFFVPQLRPPPVPGAYTYG